MKELSAKIEQISKNRWRAIVGSESDINGTYSHLSEDKSTVKFFAKTEKAVTRKANAYADKKAIEQARREAAYVIPLTAGLLESTEQKETGNRVKELNLKRKHEGLTTAEKAELARLVN